MTRETIKARVSEDKHRIGKRLLQSKDISIQDALEGWWLRLIQGDEDAEAAAAEYHRSKADVAALERREERIEERITELEEERAEVREELEDARETVAETEEMVVESAAGVGDADGEELSEVAYELMVGVAHGDVGTSRVSAGSPEVADAARRLQVDADELVREMRELARPIEDEMKYGGVDVEELFILSDQRGSRTTKGEFDEVRNVIADVVVDDEDVDEERVPESPAAAFEE